MLNHGDDGRDAKHDSNALYNDKQRRSPTTRGMRGPGSTQRSLSISGVLHRPRAPSILGRVGVLAGHSSSC